MAMFALFSVLVGAALQAEASPIAAECAANSSTDASAVASDEPDGASLLQFAGRHRHEDEERLSLNSSDSNLVLFLKITISAAWDLPNKDTTCFLNKCASDPYPFVECGFGSQRWKKRGSRVNDKLSVSWTDFSPTLRIEVDPADFRRSGWCKFSVYDFDFHNSDDLLGEVRLLAERFYPGGLARQTLTLSTGAKMRATIEVPNGWWEYDWVDVDRRGQFRTGYGVVDQLFLFAPAAVTRSYQLRNYQTESGCFSGVRIWAERDGTTDAVPTIGRRAGFRHVKIKTKKITITAPGRRDDLMDRDLWKGNEQTTPCSESMEWEPRVSVTSICGSTSCHVGWYYFEYADPEYEQLYFLAEATAERWPPSLTVQYANSIGINIVSRAKFQSFITSSDIDIVMLYQSRSTGRCVLTFEGSDRPSSPSDWISNLNSLSGWWCGFRDVHMGLAQELRTIVQNERWPFIRNKLPGCSKVDVLGHSKGTAMAALFAACANRRHKVGETGGFTEFTAGDDDLESVQWDPPVQACPDRIPPSWSTLGECSGNTWLWNEIPDKDWQQ